MTSPWYRRYWLPLILGGLSLLLLLRVFLLDGLVLIPENTDVVLLVSILSVAMIFAIHTLVRISMNYLRLLSIQQMRQETLAEHTRFLRRLDHELKNPLTTLRAGLKTLALTQLDLRQQQIIATMETETLRLSRLVTDLRKLAELETQPLNLLPVDLETFATHLLQLERERFETGNRTVTSKLDIIHKTWIVDEDLLALAIHNLFDNAFKYTEPGDTVDFLISAYQDLKIEVSNTGISIPAHVLPHIWEELYRADSTAKVEGSGIGLALVKAIIERHQGRVAVQSHPQKGTTFTLTIPPIFHP
jgi:two-component system OmpR family sensor kinase